MKEDLLDLELVHITFIDRIADRTVITTSKSQNNIATANQDPSLVN